MSLREWSEQILTGAAVADKLAPPPPRFLDEAPGPVLAAVVPPGRPAGLPLVDPRPRARFPGRGALGDPRARGEVLHFFANHELLALELMALVLLRFPDAPRAFRRGLANTMAEEQRHLSLYLGRMAELGVELGEIPVNDFFWNCLSGVDSPLAFVAGMSLTFEQANLDYALYYKDAFAESGDAQTAALMQEVYDDEVGHVRHGLRWLRRWKPAGLDEWAAHAALLQRPLTPARAKGRAFDRAGRRAAGLPEDYIDRLAVYRHSKGRPPRVFYFNPGCEEEIVRGPDADLPAAALAVQRELELLPALLAAQDDAVLLTRPPSVAHLGRLQAAGLTLPEIMAFDGADLSAHPARRRTLGGLEPWGWSPAAARLLAPLGASWDPGHAQRAGKSAGTVALRALLEEAGGADWLAEGWTVGSPCRTRAEVDGAVAAMRAAGAADVVLKAEWGAAGRGAIRLLGGAGLAGGQQRWLERTLSRQGAVVVEPWLDRVLDLSLHYDRRADGTMKSVGSIRFMADGRGQYRGHWLGRMADGLDREVIALLHGGGRQPRWRELAARVADAVSGVLGGYAGPVGVDALVYRSPADGRLRLKPVVEINPRWSMGRVAIALQKRVQPGTPACFVLARGQALRALEGQALEVGPGGRWAGGVLRLTEGEAVAAAVVLGEAAAALIG